MGFSAVWDVLERMIADFRERGITVSVGIINELKSARTLITISKADLSCGETMQKVEDSLWKVESYLVSKGQESLGIEYAEEWLSRLDEARRTFEEEKEEMRFVSGFPRGHGWIRIRPSVELPIKKLKTLAKESSLSYKVQDDGFCLIYGKDKQIRDLVKKATTYSGLRFKK